MQALKRWNYTSLLIIMLIMTCHTITGSTVGAEEAKDSPRPWFSYSPNTPKPGELVTFDASSSEGQGGILSYQWDTTGGGVHDRAGVQIRRTFDKPGKYPITLTVHDGLGRSAQVTRLVWVGMERDGVTLSINTVPGGLTVYIDGERVGQTPLKTTVSPGERSLRLRHYWLLDWETTLDLRHVSSLSLDLEFEGN